MKYLVICFTLLYIAVGFLHMADAKNELPTFGDCDESSQCLLKDLNKGVMCESAPFGHFDPPCYGYWSLFRSCNCSLPFYRISSHSATYWCNDDGHFKSELYDVQCFAPCTIDADAKAVPKNSDGLITYIIEDSDYVTYTCPEGYTSSGDKRVACRDGVWNSHRIFQCHEKCSVPQTYEFIEPSNQNPVIEGTVVSMRCRDGYLPSDKIVRTCHNGSFADLPDCHDELSCKSPGLKDNLVDMTPYESNYPEGSKVHFSCPAGFELQGDSSAVCHQGEWWFSIEPTCAATSCSWSSWCDDDPPNTKFLFKDETESRDTCTETICEDPVEIECVTVDDEIPHYAFPGVSCDLSTGLYCDVGVTGICSNFQIRWRCCTTN